MRKLVIANRYPRLRGKLFTFVVNGPGSNFILQFTLGTLFVSLLKPAWFVRWCDDVEGLYNNRA